MDRFIGLDAHSQTSTLTVVGGSGRKLREQVVETNGKVLVELVRSVAGRRHLCFEEGTHSEWLYELLEPHVDEIVVVQPDRSTGRKNDSLDAFGLAEMIRKGGIKHAVFKAPKMFGDLRTAVTGHRLIVQDVVRTKNRLKAVYRSRGLSGMNDDLYDTQTRQKWTARLPVSRRPLAELLSKELESLTALREESEKMLLEKSKAHPEVARLATAPGIGPIRAAQIVATVLSPHRFRTRQQFWSYCGLGLVTRSSSDWIRDRGGNFVRRDGVQTRGLNHNRQPLLKAVFKGAALTVVQNAKLSLHQDYQRILAANIKPSLARVTVARRIASAVLAMWKNKEDYDPAKHRRSEAK